MTKLFDQFTKNHIYKPAILLCMLFTLVPITRATQQEEKPEDFACLIGYHIPSKKAKELSEFYEKTMGHSFARSLSSASHTYHTWLNPGLKFQINYPHHEAEKAMPHYAVADLEAFREKVTNNGGKLIYDIGEITIAEEMKEHYKGHYNEFKQRNEKSLIENEKALEATHIIGKSIIFQDIDNNSFIATQLTPWASVIYLGAKLTASYLHDQKLAIENGNKFEAILEATSQTK